MRLWAALALAACGGGTPPAPAAPKLAAVDDRKAEKGAKDLVDEIYEDISHAQTDSLMSLLADPLVVFGPRRADVLQTRADALLALKQVVDPKNKPSVRSAGLSVVPSPGGHSAWVIDVIEAPGGPLAMTAVLSNADDIWVVNAAALAQTPSMKAVRAELKKDAVVPAGMQGFPKVDPNAQGAVDKLTKGLADQKRWGDELSARGDAVVVGPSAGDLTKGKTDIKKLWKKRVKSNTRETIAGDTTAAATADGQLAWVSVPVVRFADDDEPLPLRVFAVYEKTAGEWKMIALQESLAVDAPGVGAPFKKVVAPALPKVEEPPKKPDDTPPKKKKKKKKKPPPTDDQ